jgi:hypothetical protein
VVEGLTAPSVVDGTLLVSDGGVDVYGLDDAAVFVQGDVTVRGDVLDALVVCTGAITVQGTVKRSLLLTRGSLRCDGYLKESLVEAQVARSSGYSKRCVWVRTRREVGRQQHDRVLEEEPSLFALFRGR